LIFLVDLSKITLLELNHLPLDLPVPLSNSVGEVGGRVGASGVDEGEALGEVVVGIFEVVTHYFNIKIYANESILNTVSPLERILQFLTTQLPVVVLVHRIYKLEDLQLRRHMFLPLMQQGVLN